MKLIHLCIKSICISYSINIVISRYIGKVQRIHKKNLDKLIKNIQQEDGLETNPNNIIWNLTSRSLSMRI